MFWPEHKLMIEYSYIIDLDREIFTINNGAHLHLDRIPRHDWLDATCVGPRSDQLILPGLLPEGATADIVVCLPEPLKEDLQFYGNLYVNIVIPKRIEGFPPSQRHGPLFRSRIFQSFASRHSHPRYPSILSVSLPAWNAGDFIFREYAYTILCLASAGQNMSLIQQRRVFTETTAHLTGFSVIQLGARRQDKHEFVSHMGYGAHRDGYLPGSAPESTMYWFEGALIYLVAHLSRPQAVPEAIARLAKHCQTNCPRTTVNAVLMSIEHTVLVRIDSEGRVERTSLLPLFVIQTHWPTNARDRYSEAELAQFDKKQLRRTKNKEAEGLKEHERYARRRRLLLRKGNEKSAALARAQNVATKVPKPVNEPESEDAGDVGPELDEADGIAERMGTERVQQEAVDYEPVKHGDKERDDEDGNKRLKVPNGSSGHIAEETNEVEHVRDEGEKDEGEKDEGEKDEEDENDEDENDEDENEEDETEDEDDEDEETDSEGNDQDGKEDIDPHQEERDRKDTQGAFVALMHILEASKTEQIQLQELTNGYFPPEMYSLIIDHVNDISTWHALMQVSLTFRNLCQRNVVLTSARGGVSLHPNEASKNCVDASDSKLALRMMRMDNGARVDAPLTMQKDCFRDRYRSPKGRDWQIVVGGERHRRSLLLGFALHVDNL